jgi:Trk-type K+ transport system membrane component
MAVSSAVSKSTSTFSTVGVSVGTILTPLTSFSSAARLMIVLTSSSLFRTWAWASRISA